MEKIARPVNTMQAAKKSLRELDKILFEPLLPLLGEKKNILLPPDGF